MILPYLRVANKYNSVTSSTINQILHDGLTLSAKNPCYLDVTNGVDRLLLFFRDKQIYNAGRLEKDQFAEVSIKDFLQAAIMMEAAVARICEVNSKILHSLLIIVQKKPALRLLTSIVDLDEVLDKIEEEGKSCIVSASQDQFLALLRYEKGEVTALCHEISAAAPQESSFREDFLVKIYTLSAEKPLTITVYEDLLVRYANDAKMIGDEYQGDITDLYMTRPPVVTLAFKGTEIGNWVLDRPVFNIGRTVDNDIVIDNLAVSRLHAVLERDKGEFYIRDCDSSNGTFLNGKRIGRARLNHGDEIAIGKHKLVIEKRTGMNIPANPNIATFDQTVVIAPGQTPPQMRPAPSPSNGATSPRLIERTKSGEIIIEINKPNLVMGKDSGADIEIDGFLIAKQHAEIVVENGDYVIRHLNGYRKVSVGGKPVTECVLQDNDEIRIGKSEFIFQK